MACGATPIIMNDKRMLKNRIDENSCPFVNIRVKECDGN